MRSHLLLSTFVASVLLVMPSMAELTDAVARDAATPGSIESDALLSRNNEAEHVGRWASRDAANVADVLYTRDVNDASSLDARSSKKDRKHHKKQHKDKKSKGKRDIIIKDNALIKDSNVKDTKVISNGGGVTSFEDSSFSNVSNNDFDSEVSDDSTSIVDVDVDNDNSTTIVGRDTIQAHKNTHKKPKHESEEKKPHYDAEKYLGGYPPRKDGEKKPKGSEKKHHKVEKAKKLQKVKKAKHVEKPETKEAEKPVEPAKPAETPK